MEPEAAIDPRRQAGEPRSDRRRGRKGAGRAGGGGRGGGYRTLSSFPLSHRGSLGAAGVGQRLSPHLTPSQQPQPPQSSEPFFTSAASAASADSPRPAQEPRVTSGSGRSTSCGRQSQMIGRRSWPTWASGRGRASPVRLPPGETRFPGWRSRAAAVPTSPPRSRSCSCIPAFDSLALPCARRPVRRSVGTSPAPSPFAPSSLTRLSCPPHPRPKPAPPPSSPPLLAPGFVRNGTHLLGASVEEELRGPSDPAPSFRPL
ncbi:uncharacterized protein ACOB8E_004813 [Sarcophilus harrisii]